MSKVKGKTKHRFSGRGTFPVHGTAVRRSLSAAEALWLELKRGGLSETEILTHLARNIGEIFKRLGRTIDQTQAQGLYAFVIGRFFRSGRPRIGFFSPGPAYHDFAGHLPNELRKRGYQPVMLFGDPEDKRLADPGTFFAGGGIMAHLDWLDLVMVPSVMDGLPEKVKAFLLPHAVIGGVRWIRPGLESSQGLNHAMSPEEIARLPAVQRVPDLGRLFPLFDYVSASTDILMAGLESLPRMYGMVREGEPPIPMSADGAELLGRLPGSRRSTATLIKVPGYLPIDLLRERVGNWEGGIDSVIYAPTLTTVYDRRITSLGSMGIEVVSALLECLPDHRVIFRPHPHEDSTLVERIVKLFQGNPRFVASRHRSYVEDYARSRFMVSDISNTAYTYSLGTFRPVVFVSPGEELIHEYGDPGCDYLRLRKSLGWVVENHEELLDLLDEGEPMSVLAANRAARVIGDLLPADPPAYRLMGDIVAAILNGQPIPGGEVYQ